jgi:hypothetical protein
VKRAFRGYIGYIGSFHAHLRGNLPIFGYIGYIVI